MYKDKIHGNLIFIMGIPIQPGWCLHIETFPDNYHIKAWTKWLTFFKQHFQKHFLERKFFILHKISSKFVPQHSIDNKSANTCQAIKLELTHCPLRKFEWNFRYLIFQIISEIDGWAISWELALRWMSPDLTDDKSTLVQAMAWCRQATSHYLSQCWPGSLSPYGVTRPQWVNDDTVYWHKRYIYYTSGLNVLTHCGLVTSYPNRDLGQHWLR